MITECSDTIKAYGRARTECRNHIVEGNDIKSIKKAFNKSSGEAVAFAAYSGMSKESFLKCMSDTWEEFEFIEKSVSELE